MGKYQLLIIISFLNFNLYCFAQSESCTNAACHGSLLKQEVLHPAIDGCDNCHTATGEQHPSKGIKGFTLSDQVPQLCFTCHDANNTKTNVHPPVEGGECMICHSPHSSPQYFLLKEAPPSKLCGECHDLSMTQKKIQHEPVNSGECYKCHDPHESDYDKFLNNDIPNLCLKCHEQTKELFELQSVHAPFKDNCLKCHDQIHSSDEDNLISKTPEDLCLLKCHARTIPTESGTIVNMKRLLEQNEFVHGAIGDGCLVCHNPHASENAPLLNGSFPDGEYAYGNNKNNFALCFQCHDAEPFNIAVTKTATAFRNGNQNLHYLHVNREKGRSCITCHNVHASPNNHLILDKVPFGNWEMPMNYVLQNNGGSCSPGCHSEKKYER